jgi:hypothetical protein
MTFTMAAHIIFSANDRRGAIELRQVSEVSIERSWKEFTGRAEITMPRNIRILNNMTNVKYADIFKNGDAVEIRIGYGDAVLPVEFTGYITEVSEGVPVVIRCEDEMYKLKRGNVSITASSITLKNLLTQAAKGYTIDCPDMNLGAVRFSNVAPIAVLEQIQKDAGLYSYFDGKTLKCGVIYGDQSDVAPVRIHLEKNAVSENLNKKTGIELFLVELTSVLAKGKKNVAKAGKEGGEVFKKKYAYSVPMADLQKEADRLLKQKQTPGFDGSLTLFGIPRVQHGMKLHIQTELFTNMQGTYYVEKTVKKFGTGGYRQEVTLGDRVL